MSVRIFALAGSLRQGSFNRKLLAVAVKEAQALGAEVDVGDLKALDLPVYDGDVEAASGQPPGGKELRERIARADGFLLASPEYNHSIPGGLKNAIDWASRAPDQPFKGKVVALMGASGGHFGTVRAQAHLRQVFTALGTWLLPGGVMIPNAPSAFEETGALKDAHRAGEVKKLVESMLEEIQRRKAR